MKQFVYRDKDLVAPAIAGFLAANPQLAGLKHNVVVRRKSYHTGDKVTLLSGGGSGHEPAHLGFVGDGMLDAVACGQIFASPSATQIDHALDAVRSPKGTLVIVKNYTGDNLHFGLATEKAIAAGNRVRLIAVGDDVAVGREQGKLVGRRGLAGVILVHKIAGASAARGDDLDTVAKFAEIAVNNMATIAASLDHCVVPGRQFESDIGQDEYEIGLGIHNEAGVFRKSPIPSLGELLDSLLAFILEKNEDRSFVAFDNAEVLLLINGLGGLSPFEVSYITKAVLDKVIERGIKVSRVLSGSFVTAFNGPGFSITLLNLSKAGPDIKELMDAPASAPGWTSVVKPEQWESKLIEEHSTQETTSSASGVQLPQGFKEPLKHALTALIAAEPKITEYDTIAGDGDCGETLKSGAEAVLARLDSLPEDAVHAVIAIADVVGEAMGGTSGGLYSIFITAFARAVREASPRVLDVPAAAKAANAALQTLYKYTKARVADRTLIDALDPFVSTLQQQSVQEAVQAAVDGAASTAKLQAKAGRAAYVKQDSLENVPDPGAYGLAELLKGWH